MKYIPLFATMVLATSFAFRSATFIQRVPSLLKLPPRASFSQCQPLVLHSRSFSVTEFNSNGANECQGYDDLQSEIASRLTAVREAVSAAEEKAGISTGTVRLVAVSKTKPVEALEAAYHAGQRAFGENYVQEIIAKSPQLPTDIKWHFIGPIQSNKAKQLIKGVPNLEVVETVSSEKIANRLNQACEEINREPLRVFLQIDTSGEENKAGVQKEESLQLACHIISKCHNLKLAGLMTIGKYGDMTCFDRLVESREYISSGLNINANELELSMGMSSDFDEAILRGSTNVRVGTTIFGERDYSKKK